MMKRLILAVVLLSYFVTAINGAIVITGLTSMARELVIGQSALSWAQNAYVLAWGGFMLLGGRLSDTFGRRCILNLSLILFGLGSLAAGVAPDVSILIAARFVQGAGAAILAPTSLALIMDYFSGEERVKAVAWYSSISGLGMCLGLIIGGVLTDFFSWRYGFVSYLPLIVIMLIISCKVLPSQKVEKSERSGFDIVGTLCSAGGVFALVYAINGADRVWFWLVAAVVILSVFIHTEKGNTNPIIPLRLFNNLRSRANLSRLFFAGSMMGFYFFMSEYLQDVLALSPLMVGVAFFPLTIFTFIGAMTVPYCVGRCGNRRTLFVGYMLMIVGFAYLLGIGWGVDYVSGVAVPMSLLGLGQGLVMSPLTNLGISDVPRQDTGAASGVVNASHQIGCSVGLSVMIAATSGMSDMAEICYDAMIVGLGMTLFAFSVIFVNKYNKTSVTKGLWKQ